MSSRHKHRHKRWVAPEGAELASSGKRPQAQHRSFSLHAVSSFLTGGSRGRVLYALAWPIAAAMLGEVAIGLVDTFLVGGLGPSALGGMGIATTLMFLGYAFVFGFMRGVKVRTAHAVGAGTPEKGLRYLAAGLLAGVTLGVIVLLATRDVTPLLDLLKIDPKITPYARDSLAALTCGAPATCSLTALVQYRQGRGDSRTPMIVGISGNVINAVLGWSLIYGHLGLPALGVRGAGYATATTEYLEVIALGIITLREGVRGVRSPSLARAFVEVSELGLPTGFQFVCEMLAFTVFTAILGEIGAEQIAAHQIALMVLRMSFLPGIAIAEAASVLVGQALGKRRLSEADEVTRAALRAAVTFMALCGVAFAFGASVIAHAFTDDERVALIAKRLLWVSAAFQVLDAISIVLRGALRGAKDVRMVALAGIAISWTCVPVAAYLLGKVLGLGALGGWLGFIAETLASTIVFSARWKRGPWRRAYGESGESGHSERRARIERGQSGQSERRDDEAKTELPGAA